MQQCQELIEKVREFRYLKVRERQINKFNLLLQNQEGNITCASNTPNPSKGDRTCAGKHLTLSQGGAQVQAVLQPTQADQSQSQ